MQKLPACPKCSSAFMAKDPGGRCQRRPLLLHCGHTFCEACLTHMLKERKTGWLCNICSAETTFKPGETVSVKQLYPDRYMLGQLIHTEKVVLEQELSKLKPGLMAMSQPRRSHSGCSYTSLNQFSDDKFSPDKDKICKECMKRQATSHCAKCECNMCSTCFQKVHSLSNTLRQHQAQPIPDEVQLEVSQMCKIHENRPIEYYCEDDETIICSRCVIVGTHKGHNISSIEDKNRLIVNEMEPNLQRANQVLRRLKKIDKDLSCLVPDVRRETEPALAALQRHFQHLHGVLQIQQQALEAQVLQVFQAGVEPLEKLRTELYNEQKQLEIAIKSAHRIMNNNDEVIVNAKDILDRLVHARDVPCILELQEDPPETQKISFIPGTSLEEPGQVGGAVPQRFTMWTLAEKPEKFTEDQESLCSNLSESDSRSVQSIQSEDVIIEDEQVVLLDTDDAASVKSTSSNTCNAKPKARNKTKLPGKARLRGQNQRVQVTHINSPHSFMVQLKSDLSKLTTMSYAIQQFCKAVATSQKHRVTGVSVDDIVLAQYSIDKEWYRARIKNVLNEDPDADLDEVNVEVVYIDYGNKEVQMASRLLNMQSKFMKHPEFAIECGLFNILPKDKDGCWASEAVQTFAKIVSNKQMIMSVVREENNVMLVDLCKPPDEDIADDRPVSMRDFLVFMELASLESPNSLPVPGGAPAPKRNYISPDPKEPGELYDVSISYCGTPHCFYAQEQGEEFQYLATMMAHIQDTYCRDMKESWHILCPQLGMICVAKFSGDGLWYRARIIGLPGNREVELQYVDYGNKETLSVFKIRKIIDSFLILPAQALCCRLVDVEPHNSNEGWPDESLRWWADRVNSADFEMKVIEAGAWLQVVLRDPGGDAQGWPLNVEIVARGQARSTGKWSENPSMGEEQSVMSSHVPRLSYCAGDGMFPEPCELEHQPVYWKSRNSRPVRRYQETVLTPPHSPERGQELPTSRPQQPPAPARSPGQQVSPQQQNVRMEDRSPGQLTEEAEPKKLKTPSPRTAAKTPSPKSSEASPTVKKSSKHTHSAKKKGKKEFDQEVIVSHFVSPAQFHVQMANAGIKGLDESVAPKKESVAPKKEMRGPYQEETVVSHYVSPAQFYLQRAEAVATDLEELMSQMQAEYRSSEVAWVSWNKGCYCAVLSPKYGRWYRGIISKVLQKNLMEVFMLDYGFTEMVSTANLRSILRQYRHHRCFSFPCHLAAVTPAGGMNEWSKTACEFMQEQILNRKIFIQKKGNVENKSLPIDLIIEDYIEETALEPGRKVYLHLTDLMKERGLAIPVTKKRGEQAQTPQSFPVLYYKKAEAEVKTGDKVMPVYVDYDAVIHCYTMEGDDAFQSMCDTLHQKFKDSDPHGDEQHWVRGQACAAFFTKDGQWHRATINQLEPTRAQIHFIDYGNTEWVEFDQLRADIEEFADIPQQTFLCTLHDIRPRTEDGKWDVTSLEYMHKLLVNKYCIITVIEKNGFENEYMTVNLDLSGMNVTSHLVQYGIAQRGEYITDQEEQSRQIDKVLSSQKSYKVMPPLPVGEVVPVLVTHVELPNIVYIQHQPREVTGELGDEQRRKVMLVNEWLQKLEKLSADLNKAAPGLPSVPQPQIGLQCCAQFAFDMCWYRAVIVDVYPDTKQFLVVFVDYGNSEVLTIQKLRALPPKYHSLPCQAVRTRLAHLAAPAGVVSWTKTSLIAMMSTLANKPLQATVMSQRPFTVELHEQTSEGVAEEPVYQPVIEKGYVTYSPPSLDTPPAIEKPEEPFSPEKAQSASVASPTKATSCHSDTEDEPSSASTVAMTTDSTASKSWAEMAEEDSVVDMTELPKFDDDLCDTAEDGDIAATPGAGDPTNDGDAGKKKKKKRTARLKSIVNEDECFD